MNSYEEVLEAAGSKPVSTTRLENGQFLYNPALKPSPLDVLYLLSKKTGLVEGSCKIDYVPLIKNKYPDWMYTIIFANDADSLFPFLNEDVVNNVNDMLSDGWYAPLFMVYRGCPVIVPRFMNNPARMDPHRVQIWEVPVSLLVNDLLRLLTYSTATRQYSGLIDNFIVRPRMESEKLVELF